MVIGISKTEIRSIYSIDKTQDFWKKARSFLLKAGVVESYAEDFGYEGHLKKKEQDITKVRDYKYENKFSNKDASIDFIFGDKKIFIIITYKKDMQQKFSKLIFDCFGE